MRKLFLAAAILAMSAGTASAASIGLVADDGCLSYGGVYFCDADIQPTGTGIFNPFLRTNPGGGLDPSSGWNTDANKNTWTQENDADDAWTSALLASSLQTVSYNGEDYKLFTVDINQQGIVGDPNSLLSLIHFQLYSCSSATYTSLSGCTSLLNLFGGTVTYDAQGRPVISDTTWVDFNYRIHTGSGSGDINVYVPVSVFAGAQYIALLDGWGTSGSSGNYGDNDGFQEWAARQGPTSVPEPASLLLFGTALSAFAVRLRSRRKEV